MRLRCTNCDEGFSIPTKEHTRQVKQGRAPDHFFCTTSCSASYSSVRRSGKAAADRREYMSKLQAPAKPSHPFTFLVKSLRRGVKRKGGDLSIDSCYLQDLYNKQKGKCILSGLGMTTRHWDGCKSPYMASIDRIDNSKGYSRDNIQLVCYSVNMARSDFSIEEIKSFLEAIKKVEL